MLILQRQNNTTTYYKQFIKTNHYEKNVPMQSFDRRIGIILFTG